MRIVYNAYKKNNDILLLNEADVITQAFVKYRLELRKAMILPVKKEWIAVEKKRSTLIFGSARAHLIYERKDNQSVGELVKEKVKESKKVKKEKKKSKRNETS